MQNNELILTGVYICNQHEASVECKEAKRWCVILEKLMCHGKEAKNWRIIEIYLKYSTNQDMKSVYLRSETYPIMVIREDP